VSELPIELPLHRLFLAEQTRLLDMLLSPMRLHRVVDNHARAAPSESPLSLAELLEALTGTRELDGKKIAIDSFRCNLERAWLVRLIGLVWGRAAEPPVLGLQLPDALPPTPLPSPRGRAR
jgi:hypothetical protein